MLESVMSSMVITDSSQFGCPILFATKGFAEAVGSHRDELLGKSVFQVGASMHALQVNQYSCWTDALLTLGGTASLFAHSYVAQSGVGIEKTLYTATKL